MSDREAMLDRGYNDGFDGKEKLSASQLENNVQAYMIGYQKGKEDREFYDEFGKEE